MRVPSSRIARTPPQMARAIDSVPPDVKTISSACAPIASATCSRAPSRSARAARPGVWIDSGSPYASSAAISASRASGSRGVAEAESRYRSATIAASGYPGAAPGLRGGGFPAAEEHRGVQHAGDDPPGDRPDDPHERVVPQPTDQRRSEPAGGIHRRAGQGPEGEDVERDRQADREAGGLVPRSAVVHGGAEHHEHEEERQDRLEDDALADGDVGSERRGARAARVEQVAADHETDEERAHDRAQELRDDQ